MPARIGTGPAASPSRVLENWPIDLGMVNSTNLMVTNSLEGGEVRAYQFTVPAGLTSLEAQLQTSPAVPPWSCAPAVLSQIPGRHPRRRCGRGGCGRLWQSGWLYPHRRRRQRQFQSHLGGESRGRRLHGDGQARRQHLITNATTRSSSGPRATLPIAFDGGGFVATNHTAGTGVIIAWTCWPIHWAGTSASPMSPPGCPSSWSPATFSPPP